MANLECFNIKIDRSKETNDIVIKGEVSNKTDKNYSTVALRIIVFIKNISIANVVVLINGLSMGTTRAFEKNVEDLKYDSVARDITRYETYIESAY